MLELRNSTEFGSFQSKIDARLASREDDTLNHLDDFGVEGASG